MTKTCNARSCRTSRNSDLHVLFSWGRNGPCMSC